MKPTLMACAKFALFGVALAGLTACVDPEEQARQEQAALATKSCSELAVMAAVKKEKIAEQKRKGIAYSLASALSSGSKSDTSGLSASLAQTMQNTLQGELHQIELLMARKRCN